MPVDYKFDSALFGDAEQFDVKAFYYFTLNESVPVDGQVARKLIATRRIYEPMPGGKFDSALFGDENQFDVQLPNITWADSVTGIRMRLATISEPAITITDSVARMLLAKVTMVENVVVSEVLAKVAIFKRTIIEPFKAMFDDALFGDATQFDIQAQAINFADSVVAVARKVANMSETVTSTDSVARRLFAFRTIAEPIVNVVDSVARIFMAKRTMSEPAISDSDTVTAQRKAFGNLTESIPMSENLARRLFAFRTILEPAVNFVDNAARTYLARRTMVENVTTTDSVTGLRKFIINITEPVITITGSLQVTLFNLIIRVTSYLQDRISGDSTVSDNLSKTSYIQDREDL